MASAVKPKLLLQQAFTVKYNAQAARLTSDVQIFPAFAPGQPALAGKKYVGLYDTGATHSAISPTVVTDLELTAVGAMTVYVGGGQLSTTTHLVNVSLPNGVVFGMVPVAKMILKDFDVIIGMDILGAGDLSVTHLNGQTTFSFCTPSSRSIDFVAEVNTNIKNSVPKVGRNDPCSCGSGQKYKKCHGRY